MSAIYRILNVATDQFYIGSSVNVRRRRWEHWDSLKKGKHHCDALQAAWAEYGEDAFEFEVIEEVTDDAELLRVEETYLMKFAGSTECYNTAVSAHQSPAALPRVRAKISEGLRRKYEDPTYVPRLGKRHTEETKSKISAKVQAAVAEGRSGKFIPSEETRKRMSQALKGNQNAKGHIRTEEHRRKLSEANKGNQNWLGRSHTEEAKAKISKRVLETTTGIEFPSLTATLEHYGLKMPTLRRALVTGKPIAKGIHKGLIFVYAESSSGAA
jgi:group I intron endonuclease